MGRGYQQRMDNQAWLTGRYVQEVIFAALTAVLGKKGHTPHKYPSQPYSAQQADTEGQGEEKDALRAKLYMRQMVQVGKNWGKPSN